MMKTQMKNRDTNKELMEAFQVFDCNRNGRIRYDVDVASFIQLQ